MSRPDYYKAEVTVTLPDGTRTKATLECFDLIDSLGGGFYFGNVIKYLFRAGRKTVDRLPDLNKAETYIGQEIHRELRSKRAADQ